MTRAIIFALILASFVVQVFGAVDDTYTKSLLHFDGGITDESGKTWTAADGAGASSAQKKFGTGSLFCDGSSDFVSTPDSTDFDFGNGSWTIDYWEYRTSASPDSSVISRRLNVSGSSNAIFRVGYADYPGLSGRVALLIDNGVGSLLHVVDMGAYSVGSWVHFAVSRTSDSYYTFRDGIKIGAASTTANLPAGSADIALGKMQTNGYYYTGYIDEMRISKGIARYTADFTPPSAAYGGLTPPVVAGARIAFSANGSVDLAGSGKIEVAR